MLGPCGPFCFSLFVLKPTATPSHSLAGRVDILCFCSGLSAADVLHIVRAQLHAQIHTVTATYRIAFHIHM